MTAFNMLQDDGIALGNPLSGPNLGKAMVAAIDRRDTQRRFWAPAPRCRRHSTVPTAATIETKSARPQSPAIPPAHGLPAQSGYNCDELERHVNQRLLYPSFAVAAENVVEQWRAVSIAASLTIVRSPTSGPSTCSTCPCRRIAPAICGGRSGWTGVTDNSRTTAAGKTRVPSARLVNPGRKFAGAGLRNA